MTVQLAPDEPLSPKLARERQAWMKAYPWLHRALDEIGPGAWAVSDSWRMLIEEELKTTLDFKVRPDGTATVWCGMSSRDFHHYPTTKELFEGLGEVYRRERERRKQVADSPRETSAGVRPARPRMPLPVRVLPQPIQDSLARALGAVLVTRVEQLALILLSMTAITLTLAVVALAVR